MQLIDKDKVEEILRNLWKEDDGHNSEHRICYNKALQEVQCEIDTLEVKEVSLEEELSYEDYRGFFEKYPNLSLDDWGFDETWMFAQYCYKLGLKVRKEEEV